jgi:hypothetical protein
MHPFPLQVWFKLMRQLLHATTLTGIQAMANFATDDDAGGRFALHCCFPVP